MPFTPGPFTPLTVSLFQKKRNVYIDEACVCVVDEARCMHWRLVVDQQVCVSLVSRTGNFAVTQEVLPRAAYNEQMARIILVTTLASFDYTLHVGNTLAPSYNKEAKGGLLCNAGPPARQTVKLTPADAEAECVPLANRMARFLASGVNTTGWYTGIKLATNGTPTLCTASSQPRCESALDGATGAAAMCSTFDAWNVQQPFACHASSCRQFVHSCSDSDSCDNVKAGPTMLGSTCYDLWQGECIRRPIKSGTHHVACGDEEEACFPSSATVTLSDGTSSRIDALKEGDKVVAATSNGTLVHDTVSILSIVKVST